MRNSFKNFIEAVSHLFLRGGVFQSGFMRGRKASRSPRGTPTYLKAAERFIGRREG